MGHGDRVQDAGTGGVGVGVDGEGDAGALPLVDLHEFGAPAPVGDTRHLLVGEHQERPGTGGAQEGFPHRVRHAVILVPDVHAQPAAPGGRGPGQGHHLGGVGPAVGGVGQAAAQPGRAGVHGRRHLLGHGLDLLGGGRPAIVLQVPHPQGAVAHQGRHVQGQGRGPEGFYILGEAVEAEHGPVPQEVERGWRSPGLTAGGQAEGGQADAAVAHHHAGDALAELGLAGGPLEHGLVIVGMHVDEPGGQHQAGGVQAGGADGRAQRAHGGDPVAQHAHVGAEGRRARAVQHHPVADDQVKGWLACAHAWLPGPGGRDRWFRLS